MTHEAELTPEREAAVRRLLGSVGAEVPALPADVAERLDAALTDLVAERSGEEPAGPAEHLAPVVPLSSRRRRTFAALFVAAAAVVVAGIGVPLLHDDTPAQPAASSDTGVSRTPADGVPNAAGPLDDAEHNQVGGSADGRTAAEPQSYRAQMDSLLHRPSLRTDLLRLRRQIPPDTTYRSTRVHSAPGFTCARADFGRGYLLGATYAGAPAVVAFRRPVGSTQVAEVLQCGTGTVLRSITLTRS
ncbi:hypothetical protein [Nocardioides ultimimeridianus]